MSEIVRVSKIFNSSNDFIIILVLAYILWYLAWNRSPMMSVLFVFVLNHLLKLLKFSFHMLLLLLFESLLNHFDLFLLIWEDYWFFLFIHRIIFFLFVFPFDYKLVIDSIVKLTVVVILILPVSFSASWS